MPENLDLKQFRTFVNPDMWFDECSTGPPPIGMPQESMESVPSPIIETPTPESSTACSGILPYAGASWGPYDGTHIATKGRYRTPLVMPYSYEFLAMVSEHRNTLMTIKQEVTTFIQQLGEQLRTQHHATPVLRQCICSVSRSVLTLFLPPTTRRPCPGKRT